VRALWCRRDREQRARARTPALALSCLREVVRTDARNASLWPQDGPRGDYPCALQVVLHRGSLRAAEEQTGHNHETIAAWIKRLGSLAEAITDLRARDLHLSEVELDELWSFVGKKGGIKDRESKASRVQRKTQGSVGAA
jgi:hypothetical protein